MKLLRGRAELRGAPRHGRMHEGVPPGGAFVPELLAAANLAAGNPPDAPALEYFAPIEVALDGPAATDAERVAAGTARLVPRHRAGYLAIGPAARAPDPPPWSDDPFGVILGPDAGDTGALLGATFRMSPVGDRVGVRLDGPPVAAPPLDASAPMVRGAIQATPSGQLVVLGPDHPTTGGYPVIAVVRAADLGRLFALRPGAALRFRAC
jgi:allophanate hydrolase subunit 2